MIEKYILRNPIYLEPHDMPPEYFLWDYDSNPDGVVMEFTPEQVDELFVPLDIPAIEKQLYDIIHECHNECPHPDENGNARTHHDMYFVEKIKALFGLENKEQNNDINN